MRRLAVRVRPSAPSRLVSGCRGRAFFVVVNAVAPSEHTICANLTLDATANTDFAQVEADPQRVNLTRCSPFVPEKRRFC
jgi:hypothetical protein